MIYVYKIGPVRLGDGAVNYYFAANDDELLGPVFGRDDVDALVAIREKGDGPYLCAANLADAGRIAGFSVAPIPGDLMPPILTFSLLCAWGMSLDRWTNGDTIEVFAEAAAAFAAARPWERFTSDDPIAVTITGTNPAVYEACVMGAGGDSFGLMLYPVPGSIARVSELVASGREEEAKRTDFLSFSLEDEPAYAREAMEHAHGCGKVPQPMRVTGGRIVETDAADLLVLAAAMAAIIALTEGDIVGAGEVRVDPVELYAHACSVTNAPVDVPRDLARNVVDLSEALDDDEAEDDEEVAVPEWAGAVAKEYRLKGEMREVFLESASVLRAVGGLAVEDVARRVLDAVHEQRIRSPFELAVLCGLLAKTPDALVMEFLASETMGVLDLQVAAANARLDEALPSILADAEARLADPSLDGAERARLEMAVRALRRRRDGDASLTPSC